LLFFNYKFNKILCDICTLCTCIDMAVVGIDEKNK